jgi:hypothetical protein
MIYNLLGLRRSGIHMLANYIAAASKSKLHSNLTHDTLGTKGKDVYSNNVYVYEDINPATVTDLSPAELTICIVRDPLNLAASRIKHYDAISSEGNWISRIVSLFAHGVYHKMMLDKTKIGDTATIYVIYNKFVKDVSYRKSFLESITKFQKDLDFQAAEDTLKLVSITGASTWDSRDVSPVDMQTDQRYLYYSDLPAFRHLLPTELLAQAETVYDVRYNFLHEAEAELPCTWTGVEPEQPAVEPETEEAAQ